MTSPLKSPSFFLCPFFLHNIGLRLLVYIEHIVRLGTVLDFNHGASRRRFRVSRYRHFVNDALRHRQSGDSAYTRGKPDSDRKRCRTGVQPPSLQTSHQITNQEPGCDCWLCERGGWAQAKLRRTIGLSGCPPSVSAYVPAIVLDGTNTLHSWVDQKGHASSRRRAHCTMAIHRHCPSPSENVKH